MAQRTSSSAGIEPLRRVDSDLWETVGHNLVALHLLDTNARRIAPEIGELPASCMAGDLETQIDLDDHP